MKEHAAYWSRRAAIDVIEGRSTDVSSIEEHVASMAQEDITKNLTVMTKKSPHFGDFQSFRVMIPIYENHLKG